MKKLFKIKPWYIVILALILIWIAIFFLIRNQKIKDWKDYNDTNYWISLQYPSNRQTKSVQNTVFSAFSPIEWDRDIFQENINIVISDNFGQDLDKFSAQQIDLLKKSSNFKDLVIQEEWYTKLGNKEAYKILYTWKISWYDLKLKWMQIWAVKWSTSYIFTYNWEEANFDKYFNKIKNVINTLTIK